MPNTTTNTSNRAYPLPTAGNDLAYDVAKIITALTVIDADVATAFAQIAAKAGLASPAFSGTPTAPTAAPGTNTGQLATTAFVVAAVNALVNSSPGALDTLNELAAALGNDPNFATTMVNALAGKADQAATATALSAKLDKAGGTMTGALVLAADPAAALQPATKQYADGKATQFQSISASVAANALTVGWTPDGKVSFRNPTLANGAPVAVQVASALSLAVPSGATLGTTNGQQAVLALLLLYNAGSPVLGVVNAASGLNLDETGLVSSTAISGASNSASTIYSASAVTNSPYRVLGTVTITEATAGTWASAPTLVQGDGGRGLSRALPVQSMVRVNAANGYGSTNTKIRRFSTVVVNQGSDITYADSATLGASFTVNVNGTYAISYTDQFSSSAYIGVSLNTTQPTVSLASLTNTSEILCSGNPTTNTPVTIGSAVYLTAGSVIRPHTDGAATGANSWAGQFTMTRIG